MLSYRHAFHAGNYADVLKHLTLSEVLSYLLRKSAPIMYIDTHAGAGQYALTSQMANKTGEYRAGIGKLDFSRLLAADSYARIITPMLREQRYPGSPALAARLLRQHDQIRLFELHSSDYPALQQLFQHDPRVRVAQADGWQGLATLLPVKAARAVVLIDPSYEIKTDYQRVPEALLKAYRSMRNAVLLVWYPVIRRVQTEALLAPLRDGPVRDVWRYQLSIGPDSNATGMHACGMLAVNPPWVLAERMREWLPELVKQLAPEHGSWLVECLTPE